MIAAVIRQPLKLTAPTIAAAASGSNAIVISLTKAGKADPSVAVSGYRLFRAPTQGGPWAILATVTPAQFPYTDPVGAGATFSYQAFTVDTSPQRNLSPASIVVTAMTSSGGSLPGAIASLSGVGQSPSQIKWDWPVATGATSYTFRPTGLPAITGILTNSYTQGGLSASQSVTATAEGVNTFGSGSKSPSATASSLGTGTTLSNDPFPRGYLMVQGGQSQYNSSSFKTMAARWNIIDMNPYLGNERDLGSGVTFANICAAIQGVNNGIIKRTSFYIVDQTNANTFNAWKARIENENWWLHSSYPGNDSNIVPDSFGGGNCNNSAIIITKKKTSQTFFQAFAQYFYDVFVLGLAQSKYGESAIFAPNPNLKMVMMDNRFWKARASGDWNMDGSSDNGDPSDLQLGHKLACDAVRAVWPGVLIVGNCDFFNNYTKNGGAGNPFIHSSNIALYDGVLCETAIGQGLQSKETFGGFQGLMDALIASEAMIAPGGTLIVNQAGRTGGANWSSNQGSWGTQDWQGGRCGAALTYMRNAHWAPTADQNYSTQEILFFDELQPSGFPLGWLGGVAGADPVQNGARQNGVWWRDFPNGRVYCNPRGNGVRNITVDVSMHRIPTAGFGTSSVNNGASVPAGSTITLQDGGLGDGLFLVRP